MKVLITRPLIDAETFAHSCKNHGFDPVFAPMMRIEFKRTDVSLENVEALAFTSANGVRAFVDASADRSIRVFAVGHVTAQCAQENGFVDITIATGDVDSLADAISTSEISGTIVHIAGTHRAGDLAALLASRNISVRREVLYEAVETTSLNDLTREFLNDAKPGYICFFSPRTAQIFCRLVSSADLVAGLAAKTAICLSDNVSAVLSPSDWARIDIAKRRHGDAMIDAMTEINDA